MATEVRAQQVFNAPEFLVGPVIKTQESAFNDKAVSAAATFDPATHLTYEPPGNIIMMKDLGYDEDAGVSPVAVSLPFQLFSEEAINEMRTEIFKPEVLRDCSFSSNIAAHQFRGYAAKYAPFTYDAWHCPETLAIISKIAGVDLVPVMDYEIGHINLSMKTAQQTAEELDAINKQKSFFAADEGIAGCPFEDDKPIVGWHTDSYPFVCVTMLSDCTDMVGGETALRTADGNVIKVRGPGKGCAVVLQGRYITHQALRALGARERITSVTSFRPRSAQLKDDSVLTTVRGISDVSELHYEFIEYRLEIQQERMRVLQKELRKSRHAGRKCPTSLVKNFLREQKHFIKHTNTELVPENDIIAGYIPPMDGNLDVIIIIDDNRSV
ncbi:hypothetical protein EJ05DRAFT_485284 [Pseudovirgaria hyperparasitica]|uniref:Fe2OG dioxygenase domain-containing protein n=1 Tax=Pseudovirgaria hyperparasitica TaxID=470096 RepID=A0A6A6WBM1_9PEZI|nr:uncharacterized protein EJ05DRAFT_485284 [Pseudovirgaria hyperparasitica]KAF2759236.1 hypothetical protein EJ05DRAFT_485284 [Pseudovirgaria hyperparasitica]